MNPTEVNWNEWAKNLARSIEDALKNHCIKDTPGNHPVILIVCGMILQPPSNEAPSADNSTAPQPRQRLLYCPDDDQFFRPTPKDRRILEVLRQADHPLKATQIIVRAGMAYDSYARDRLRVLTHVGLVRRIPGARYEIVRPTNPPHNTEATSAE